MFDRAVREIFAKGGFSAEMLADPAVRPLIEETFNTLNGAINTAIKTETPPELTAALQNNAFIFSGFKTYHSLSEVGLALTDADGNVKPFETFRKDVEAIDSKYNTNYLYAEYNHALSTSQMAVKWHDIMQDGDRYNLQYRTAGDERVRSEHATLDNTTLPPSDEFWKFYLPPNGWNCRCTVEQVLRDDYPMSDPEVAKAAGDACTDEPKARMFRYNAGREMTIFPKKHPYLPKGCGNCNASLKLAYDPNSEKCKTCAIIGKLAVDCGRLREYNCLKNDPNYTKVEYNALTGGLRAVHKDHNFDNDFGKFKIPRGQYEILASQALFEKGYSVILQSEKKPDGIKCPDGYLNGVLMDIKGIEGNPLYSLMRANKQEVKTAILYFHESEMYSHDGIIGNLDYLPKLLEKNKVRNPIIHIETVVCVVRQPDGTYLIDEIKNPAHSVGRQP